MQKIAIIGGSGYTGRELLKILLKHKKVEVTKITSENNAGKKIEELHPELFGCYDLRFEKYNWQTIKNNCNIVFLCLPHAASMNFAKETYDSDKIVIDLSADFRIKNIPVYEKWYKVKHTQVELLKTAVYGLPELHRYAIKQAKLIANPGCYATSIILPLYPLIKENLITDNIIVDAKSGVSGAGKKMAMPYLYNEQNENFMPYNPGTHRHTPEVLEILGIKNLTLVPHLLPITRGIISTIYCTPKQGLTQEKINNTYDKYYKNEKFIRLLKNEIYPQARTVANTNFCDIGFKLLENKLILISGLDNLLKGASGQAVQNMNIILGFDENESLS
ncbi:MAG: N-acetyl-gamma-glutamyl-phosphate reductase [bacterium]|nr:N-acetyl-gamma-glutamyl-phosphate reductase [bacterium]